MIKEIYKRELIMKIIITFCLITMFISCNNVHKTDKVSVMYLDKSNIKDRIYIDDSNASNLFIQKYGLSHLINHKLYKIGTEIHLELYFSNHFSFQEGKNALTYFSKIITYTGNRFSQPYEKILQSLSKENKINLRIFINKNLLLFKSYNFATNRFQYYENMSFIADRVYNGTNRAIFIDYIN
ncbi:MAG: hypothetical protein MJB14_09630, partial [Spirochaetes bacterium]|nr:hypothetical protein [Spirochaetota bacterium]